MPLLQAFCHAANATSSETMYLPLKMLQLSPSILKGLESKPLVYIDDIDTVLGRLDWEEALLHFYDRAQEFQKKLVVTGNCVSRAIKLPIS